MNMAPLRLVVGILVIVMAVSVQRAGAVVESQPPALMGAGHVHEVQGPQWLDDLLAVPYLTGGVLLPERLERVLSGAGGLKIPGGAGKRVIASAAPKTQPAAVTDQIRHSTEPDAFSDSEDEEPWNLIYNRVRRDNKLLAGKSLPSGSLFSPWSPISSTARTVMVVPVGAGTRPMSGSAANSKTQGVPRSTVATVKPADRSDQGVNRNVPAGARSVKSDISGGAQSGPVSARPSISGASAVKPQGPVAEAGQVKNIRVGSANSASVPRQVVFTGTSASETLGKRQPTVSATRQHDRTNSRTQPDRAGIMSSSTSAPSKK